MYYVYYSYNDMYFILLYKFLQLKAVLIYQKEKQLSTTTSSVATFAVSVRYGFYHLPVIKTSQVLHDCQKSKRTYSEGLYRIVILKNVSLSKLTSVVESC